MEVYARKAGNYYFILYFKKKRHTSFLAANLFNCASTLWMDYVGVLKYIWKFYSVRFGIVKKYCIVLSAHLLVPGQKVVPRTVKIHRP